VSDALKDQIMNQLDDLSEDEQRRILELARALAMSTPTGLTGK
jgi:hypothetical protein